MDHIVVDESPEPLSKEKEAALRDPKLARVRQVRKRARRLLGLRWYGLPTRSEAAWHLTQLGKHLRSLTGFRP